MPQWDLLHLGNVGHLNVSKTDDETVLVNGGPQINLLPNIWRSGQFLYSI